VKNHAVLVLKKEDKILFIQRSLQKKTLPGAWSFPSGTQEEGENLFETIKRESKEELGITVEPIHEFAQTNLPEFSVSLHFIVAKIKDGEVKICQPEEIAQIAWMTLPEFFNKFSDDKIGHGLIWLRKNPETWENI